jgi:hypothetical protein
MAGWLAGLTVMRALMPQLEGREKTLSNAGLNPACRNALHGLPSD